MQNDASDDAWTSPAGESQLVTASTGEDMNGGAAIMRCQRKRIGRLVFVYTVSDLNGSTVHTPDTTWSIYSDNGGSSWSGAANIALASRGGDDGWTGSDIVACEPIELTNGDLLVALYGKNSGDSRYSVKVYSSTDSGGSWTYLSTINGEPPSDGLSYSEPMLCLLPTGRVFCTIRDLQNNTHIYTCYSDNSGSTWSTPSQAFGGSGKPSIVSHNGLILCAYRALGADAYLPAVRVSDDSGTTWSAEKTYFTGVYNFMYASWATRNNKLYQAIAIGKNAVKGTGLGSEPEADVYFVDVTVARNIDGGGAPVFGDGTTFLSVW